MIEARNLASLRYSYYKGEADQARLYGPRCINCMTKSFYQGRLDGVDLVYVPTPNGHIPITMRSLVFFNGIQNPFVLKDFTEDILSPDCTRCLRRASRQVEDGNIAVEAEVKREQEDEQITSLPISQYPHRSNENRIKLEQTDVADSAVYTCTGNVAETSTQVIEAKTETALDTDCEIIHSTASYIIDKGERKIGTSEEIAFQSIPNTFSMLTPDSEDEEQPIVVPEYFCTRKIGKSVHAAKHKICMPFLCGKKLGEPGTVSFDDLKSVHRLVRELLSTVDKGFISFLCKQFPQIKGFKFCQSCKFKCSNKLHERMEHILSFRHLQKVMNRGHVFTKDWDILKNFACRYQRSQGKSNVRK